MRVLPPQGSRSSNASSVKYDQFSWLQGLHADHFLQNNVSNISARAGYLSYGSMAGEDNKEMLVHNVPENPLFTGHEPLLSFLRIFVPFNPSPNGLSFRLLFFFFIATSSLLCFFSIVSLDLSLLLSRILFFLQKSATPFLCAISTCLWVLIFQRSSTTPIALVGMPTKLFKWTPALLQILKRCYSSIG